MCVAKGISSVGKKHELVAKLAEEKDADRDVCIYDGIISNVPSSVSPLNKQPVRYLRAVLSHHGILRVGTKEELIIRIGLFKCGQNRKARAVIPQIQQNIIDTATSKLSGCEMGQLSQKLLLGKPFLKVQEIQ